MLIARIVFQIISAILLLSLALTINGYNIDKCYKKILAAGIFLGIIFFSNMHLLSTATLRFILNWLIIYLLILKIFGFNKVNTLLVTFTIMSIGFLQDFTLTAIMLYGLHIPLAKLTADSWINILCIWSSLIPLILIIYLARQKGWKLPKKLTVSGMPVSLQETTNIFQLLIYSQFLLLLVAFIEYLINIQPYNFSLISTTNILILSYFTISIILNLFIKKIIIPVCQKDSLLKTQEAMASSFDSLTETMQAQNQEFVSHFQHISKIIEQGNFADLEKYLKSLSVEVTTINDLLKVDNPIIGALLKSKITEANVRGIQMEIDISVSLTNQGKRSFDLARIIGNLVNNAFDAVLMSKDTDRYVGVKINQVGPLFYLEVINRGPAIPTEIQKSIFETDFSTKTGTHRGLGLAIVKNLTERMSGTVRVSSNNQSGTKFTVILPAI